MRPDDERQLCHVNFPDKSPHSVDHRPFRLPHQAGEPMGSKRARRKARRRKAIGRTAAPAGGRRCYPSPIDRAVAEEIGCRYERRDLIEYDDEIVRVGVGFGGEHAGRRGCSVADLKARWRREPILECPCCGGPRPIIADTGRVPLRVSVCPDCSVRFVERQRRGAWRFTRHELPSLISVRKPTLAHLSADIAPRELVQPEKPWWARGPRPIHRPSSRMGHAHWTRWAQSRLRNWWTQRDVIGIRDHLQASMFETNIVELRAPRRLGVSVALMKRVWLQCELPQCTRCRLAWRPMVEDKPRGGPMVVVAFDLVQDEHGDGLVVAHRVCVHCWQHSTVSVTGAVTQAQLTAWVTAIRTRAHA